MKTNFSRSMTLMVVIASMCAFSCAKIDEQVPTVIPDVATVDGSATTRGYAEALAFAEKSILIVDKGVTRATSPRMIKKAGQCVTIPSTRNDSQTDTLMYVFNFENNAGFSIIAANRAVNPVLAVAESGNYTYGEDTGNENFDFYMGELTASLASIIPPGITDPITPRPLPIRVVEYNISRECEPLVPVQWNQNGVFGEYFYNGICGCVTTALVQIMAYYQWPQSITTTYSNSDYAFHGGETIELNWVSMISNPNYMVSALCREVGYRLGATPHGNSTGISKSIVPSGVRLLGYNNPSGYESFTISYIRATLDDERPVYVRGDAIHEDGGHAWIADGYEYSKIGVERYMEHTYTSPSGETWTEEVLVDSTVEIVDLVHFNWGWGAYYNGYYSPPYSVAYVNYSNASFDGLQMLTDISPNNQ